MAVKNLVTQLISNILFFMLFQSVTSAASAEEEGKIISFSKGKSLLTKKVYGKSNKTFYCDCKYQKKSIETKTCKILTKKYKKRKSRLEWEHVVPAHAFGKSFIEWRNYKKICPKSKSPRKCSAKKNLQFKEMEGNIFNLVPAVGAINALRSNYSFSEISENKYEICKGGLKLKGRKVSPPIGKKGDVARIYMYMDKKYPNRGIISKKNRKLFETWNKQDPVDTEECRINTLKAEIQSDINHFVLDSCKGKP